MASGVISFISEPQNLANGKVKFLLQLDQLPKKYDCWDLKGKVLNDKIEYNLKENPNFNDTLTIIVPKGFSSGKSQRAENARTALICATNMVISGKVGDAKATDVANAYFEWIERQTNN